MGVAEHEVGRPRARPGHMAVRRHRVAVDQQAMAEIGAGLGDQRGQRIVERLPAGADPPLRVGERQLVAVDRLAGGHDAGDRAQPRADPGAGGVDPGRQPVGEHRRIELPRLAIGIAPGAREGGGEQRGAVLRRRGEQLVDEAVLAAAQAQTVEPGGGQQFVRDSCVPSAARQTRPEWSDAPAAAPRPGQAERSRRRLARPWPY